MVDAPREPLMHDTGATPSTPCDTPMSDLSNRFQAAVSNSRNISQRPDNSTLLQIYALYKQATEGDVTGDKPGFSDLVGRAKWDAWNGFKGTSDKDAMQQYIDLIESLS
jgi:acyl-CoA-binding protein